ncbi:restriction endonuclease [Methylosarcina fibrata]|uniref:restriction endonuclease n=1 Tax=Methylosarcina fibrata TaxID=105972 RepID=UPI0003A33851|nr:restriction endonuclease [Methylosarcina fibrata]
MSIIKSIIKNIRDSRTDIASRYAGPSTSVTSETKNPELPTKWDKAFLKSLEWKRFEEISMEYLRIKNCMANVTCTGADGGIDIKISDGSGKVFAVGQCKSWSKPIGVSLIRELYGIMAADNIRHGIFLTTSEFSKEALEFAEGKNLLLIDSDEFISLVNNLDEIERKRLDNLARSGDYKVPTCVKCDIKMVKRKAKTGKNAGGEFWGCVNYPRCKITMQVKNQEFLKS